jgi:hypothetical protein
MTLSKDQVQIITEALRRHRIAMWQLRDDMTLAGNTTLAAEYLKKADAGEMLRCYLEDAHAVDVTPFDFDIHATDEEKSAPVVHCW